ncbi:MAG: PAS domain S-box protein, partial [Acidobacteria bacterium]|nr:PAS domain S-box protein [Acidobacteriota bacterium]
MTPAAAELSAEAREVFDGLTALAADACDAPLALISLADGQRRWFPSDIGTSVMDAPAAVARWAQTAAPDEMLVVPDTTADPRFADSPFVTGPPHVRFVAGVPLVTAAGVVAGTLCIMDRVPRALTEAQTRALRVLGRQVLARLELRRRSVELATRERLLAAIIDSEPECVKLLDRHGALLMMNPAGLRMIEADSFDQVLGQHIHRVVVDEYREAFQSLTEQVFRGTSGSLVYQVTGLKGTTRWLETHAVPLRDEHGAVTALLGIARDITEQTRVEQALREREASFRALFEQATDGIFVCDRDMTFLDVNTAGCAMTGYPRDELLTRRATDLLAADDLPRLSQEVVRLGSGQVLTSEWHVQRKDGSRFIAEASAKQLPDGRFQSVVRDVTARREAEEALRESEDRLRRAVTAGRVGLWDWDLQTNEVYYSPEWKRQIGFSDEEIGNTVEEWRSRVHPDDLPRVLERLDGFVSGTEPAYEAEFRFRHKNGAYRRILAQGSPVLGERGKPVRVLGSHVDITDRTELQMRLLQAQKMESIGRLAGGIAHDFNNLLTIINGSADLALLNMPREHDLRGDLEQIRLAGERAATLTRQLLAMSRQQILRAEIVDLNAVVEQMQSLLHRLIGEDIQLALTLSPEQVHIQADPSQIEQVILNLALNARDAMPDGGVVTIETGRVELDEAFAADHPTAIPGPHVVLGISDTGAGMDEVTRKRIFEPFFTTKELGKGTGLGLSTVYGIVKQSGGTVWVESQPGEGTTFRIYLPCVDEDPRRAQADTTAAGALRGTETILIVEDEHALRRLTRRFLESWGYTVLESGTGQDALDLLAQFDGTIDLMLTDVVMPGMNGRELAA